MFHGRSRGKLSRWALLWTARHEGKLFALTFALLAVAALAPIWSSRFLPLLDEPNHVSTVFVLHHYNDPWARLREFYSLNVIPAPYMGYYWLTHCIAYATGVEVANKVILSAYALAIPVAALSWAIRTGRSRWLSVFAFPLAYSFSWAHGFHPFSIGVASFFLASAVIDAFVERPRWSLGILGALLAILCELSHPLAIIALSACVPAMLLAHRTGLRRIGAVAAVFMPLAALVLYQARLPRPAFLRGNISFAIEGTHVGVAEMLKELPTYTLNSVSGPVDLVVFWVLAATSALLLFMGLGIWRARPAAPRKKPWMLRYRSALLAAVMLALYLVIPLHLSKPFDWWFVSGRYAPFICFFIFLTPAVDLRGLRLLAVIPAVAAALALPIHLSARYASFHERVKPFIRMVERTRPGEHILFLTMKPRGDPSVDIEAYNQFAAWIHVMRGGHGGSQWAFGYPFIKKKHLPTPPWFRNEAFEPAVHAGPYAYILIRDEKRPTMPRLGAEWRFVERAGAFTLYERAGAP